LDAFSLIDQEIQILEELEKIKSENGGKVELPKAEKQRSFQNITLLPNKRQEFYSQVFQPDHSLPTMTVEQWCEEQLALGNIPSQGATPEKTVEDVDNEETVDNETLKSREWENWKDENPRGAGNKNDHYFKR